MTRKPGIPEGSEETEVEGAEGKAAAEGETPPPPPVMRLRLRTIAEVRASLARIARAVLAGRLDEKRGRTGGYLLGLMLESYRTELAVTDYRLLDERIRALEERVRKDAAGG